MSKTFEDVAGGSENVYYPVPAQDEHAAKTLNFWRLCTHNYLHAQGNPAAVNLEVNWIKDDDFNAFAWRLKELDVIGVSLGVRKLLSEKFEGMVRDPECQQLLRIVINSSESVNGETGANSGGAEKFKKLSGRLLEMGLLWVFFHELGHVLNGHVEWLQRKVPTALRLDEKKRVPDFSNLDRLTLEMDADCFACRLLFLTYVQYTKNELSGEYEAPVETPDGTPYQAVVLLLIAIDSCFRAFADESITSLDEALQKVHPPAMNRSTYSNASLMELLKRERILPYQAFGTAAQIATEFVEGYYNKVQPYKYLDYKLAIPIGHQMSPMMLKNWAHLRPQLDSLKRGGVLPAVWDDTEIS